MAKVSFDGKRELRWLQEGDCFITYFDADVEFSDALWDQWLDALLRAPGTRVLLSSWGDIQPSKEQWRKATKALRDCGKKFAFVTESRPTSALVKAASWAGVDILAFRWEQLYDASVHIDLEREQRIAIRATLTALRDYFGAVAGDGELGSTVGRPVFGGTSAFGGAAPAPRDDRRDDQPRPRPSSPSPSFATKLNASNTGPSKPTGSGAGASSAEPPTRSRTPMADAASRNLEQVRQTSEEIQAKLAEIQARLRSRRIAKG